MPQMLDIKNFKVTVEVTGSVGPREREVTFIPGKGLQVEDGFEDAYDVLEGKYGWNRFLREVREQVIEEVTKHIRIKVDSVEFGRLHEDELGEFREFFEEFAPELFE